MLIVSLSSLTSIEDVVIVSPSVALLSRHTSSHSAAARLLKQDPKHQGRCPRSALKHVLELAMQWYDLILINYSSCNNLQENGVFVSQHVAESVEMFHT